MPQMPQSGQSVERFTDSTQGSPLPPSVEKAYYIKCVELKRRIREIEEANADGYLRKKRLTHAIHKLQIQQAVLLERLQKITQDTVGDGSDESDSPEPAVRPIPPPQPAEKPLRSKRPHNRKSSPSASANNDVPEEVARPLDTTQATSTPTPAASASATAVDMDATHTGAAAAPADQTRSSVPPESKPTASRDRSSTPTKSPLPKAPPMRGSTNALQRSRSHSSDAGRVQGGEDKRESVADSRRISTPTSHVKVDIEASEDTEMTEAPAATQRTEGTGGGFKAVNRD